MSSTVGTFLWSKLCQKPWSNGQSSAKSPAQTVKALPKALLKWSKLCQKPCTNGQSSAKSPAQTVKALPKALLKWAKLCQKPSSNGQSSTKSPPQIPEGKCKIILAGLSIERRWCWGQNMALKPCCVPCYSWPYGGRANITQQITNWKCWEHRQQYTRTSYWHYSKSVLAIQTMLHIYRG